MLRFVMEVDSLNVEIFFCVVLLLWFMFPTTVKASASVMLQGAMACETDKMISSLRNPKEKKIGSWRFISGDYQGVPLIVAVTHAGVSYAAAATAVGIEHFNPAAVINQGTGGGHAPSMHIFDLVIGADSFDASAWISKIEKYGADWRHIRFYAVKDDYYLTDSYRISADANLLMVAKDMSKDYHKGNTAVGTIATSNNWNRQKERILFLNKEYGSLCEDMETHAVAQICRSYGVPFIGLRVLSNTELHDEKFNPEAGHACQEFSLSVAKAYYEKYLKFMVE